MRLINETKVKGQRVILRAGFDLPVGPAGEFFAGGDLRLQKGLKTLRYLVENGARVIILNHFGRPKAQEAIYSNGRIAPLLAKALGQPVNFVPQGSGPEAEALSRGLKDGEIIFLENTRFDKREHQNDAGLAAEWARLGDLYVNDAFSAAYDVHTSLVALAKLLPSYAGFLLTEELAMMNRLMQKPDRPLVAILGGAKIDTKIGLVKRFLEHADHVLIGGALANTILHIKGVAVGRSKIDASDPAAVRGLDLTSTKLHIPVDAVVSTDPDGGAATRVAPVGRLEDNEMILDIGPDTGVLFKEIILKAKMIIWNGPLGRVEQPLFQAGTLAVISAIEESSAFAVTGGGDSMTFLASHQKLSAFDYVSTGGGTMLEFLSGKVLPAIELLG